MKKAVVLNGDANYFPMIETTMKSICAHHRDLKFYILNEDIPMEWFAVMNQRLKAIGSEVKNIKVPAWRFDHFSLPQVHIHKSTFFRYLIAEYIEESRAVYFDSDMIVTKSVEELWTLDLNGQALAAAIDLPTTENGFNAGLLVIDVDYWRDQGVGEKLIELTSQIHEHTYGDQGVLNAFFEKNWLALPLEYNLQVGSDQTEFIQGNMEWYQRFTGVPSVIHYTLGNKPWKQLKFNRFREVWWLYYGLSWDDVLLQKPSLQVKWEDFVDTPKYHTAVFTNAAEMEQLEELVRSLPEVMFNIVAHTYFAPSVMELEKYPNVAIYPNCDPIQKDKVLQEMDFYLDINYYDEIMDIINIVKHLDRPIFGFTTTTHDSSNYSQVFKPQDVNKMVEVIRTYLKTIK